LIMYLTNPVVSCFSERGIKLKENLSTAFDSPHQNEWLERFPREKCTSI